MIALIPTLPNLPTKMADIASIDTLTNLLPVQVLHDFLINMDFPADLNPYIHAAVSHYTFSL